MSQTPLSLPERTSSPVESRRDPSSDAPLDLVGLPKPLSIETPTVNNILPTLLLPKDQHPTVCSSATPGWYSIPREIEWEILRHFTKRELKIIRLVSHSLNTAIIPRLYNKIILSSDTMTISNTKKILSKYCYHIKQLDFLAVEYVNMNQAAYKREQQLSYHRREVPYETVRKSFLAYNRLRDEKTANEQKGLDVVALNQVLSKARNIRSTRLTDQWPPYCVQAFYNSLDLSKYCGHRGAPWESPILYPRSLFKPRLTSMDDLPRLTRPLQILLQQLDVTNTAISNFHITKSETKGPDSRILDLQECESKIFHSQLRQLDSFVGHFDPYLARIDETCFSHIADTLHHASKLRRLYLTMHPCHSKSLIKLCRFPRLQYLNLHGAAATQEEWTAFLLSFHLTLRQLGLWNCRATCLGTWTYVLQNALMQCDQLTTMDSGLEELLEGEPARIVARGGSWRKWLDDLE